MSTQATLPPETPAEAKSGGGVVLQRLVRGHLSATLYLGERDTPRVHPTQKPVVVMGWCMEQAGVPEGATVCDPYMGSGTTGIACLRTNRNFVGIEKDPEHFKNACARLEAECNQGALL
jgi:hypothetical protein